MDLRSKLGLYMENGRIGDAANKTGMAGREDAPGKRETTDKQETARGRKAPDMQCMTGRQDAADTKETEIAGGRKKAGMPDPAEGVGREVYDLVPDTVQSNEDGSCYLIENRYPMSWRHGGSELGDALDAGTDILAALGGPDCEGLPADSLLFLDTETTGLSGGAGTVAFLVGVGYFDDGAYVVRQYFMRDYDDEAAMLAELRLLFERFRGFVTFNGKAFDINLLQGRFISNRLKPAFRDKPNLDLLYPSRRVWGLKLESCRLGSLEENILGEFREDDIPGALIPSVYFKYVEDRDATDIKRVIRHNEWDILSMVALLNKLAVLLQNPLSAADTGYELLGLGRIFEATGKTGSMVECLEACTGSEEYAVRSQAVKRLTDVYKRDGRYELALEHWEAMEAGNAGFELFHLVEMAKYYEHKRKDPDFALVLVEKAVLNCHNAGLKGTRQYMELEKRRNRLRKKQADRRQQADLQQTVL